MRTTALATPALVDRIFTRWGTATKVVRMPPVEYSLVTVRAPRRHGELPEVEVSDGEADGVEQGHLLGVALVPAGNGGSGRGC
jgi:hypothetical protein